MWCRDTNVVVRGLIHINSASGFILQACEKPNILILFSKSVVREYRVILADPELVERYPQLELARVKASVERVEYVGEKIQPRVRFDFPRDPKDARFIELCITGHATHLITTDHDMLDLADGRDDTARRFRRRLPNLEVIEPIEFVRRYASELGIE